MNRWALAYGTVWVLLALDVFGWMAVPNWVWLLVPLLVFPLVLTEPGTGKRRSFRDGRSVPNSTEDLMDYRD